jgi:flavin-dependent dehydrogenase
VLIGDIARPHALLVGEAAGIDPILGEGIAQAVDYGALAGAYLADKLREGDLRFDDWGRRARRSTLGKDLRLRTHAMTRYYGAMREPIERYVLGNPSFLKLGMQYFGGKPRSSSECLRRRVALWLLGRLGLLSIGQDDSTRVEARSLKRGRNRDALPDRWPCW